MRKPTISFAIVSFSLLVLSGCNHANQNTYSAAAPADPPLDAKHTQILQMCNQIYNGYLLSPGAFGTNMANGNTARANCLIQSGYYKD